MSPAEKSATPASGIFFARVLTGGLLFYYHGWHKAIEGYAYFSGQADHWPLMNEVAAAGFSNPLPLAVFASIVQLLGGIFLVLGFCTRVTVLAVLGVMMGAVKTNLALHKENQLALLYLTLLAITFLLGSGPLSLDARRRIKNHSTADQTTSK